MKTLPEMSDLDDKLREILILEVYFKDESTGGKELATKTAIAQIKQAIAKELMGIIGEDDDPWYEVNNANAAIAIKLNELRATQRARLTAFIGKGVR